MKMISIALLIGGLLAKEFARLHERPTHQVAQWLTNLVLAALTGFVAYVLVVRAASLVASG
jgi:hypothetical protein